MKIRLLQVIPSEFTIAFKLRKRKRLDLTISKDVQTIIIRNINDKYYRVILDLQNVEFIDTTAIGMLLNLNEDLRKSGYDFSIINPSRQVMELLHLVPAVEELVCTSDNNGINLIRKK